MQAATNPALLQKLSKFSDQDNTIINKICQYSEKEVPSKYIEVKKIVNELIGKGEKVIIWTCYIENIEKLERYLRSCGIECRTLYGAIPIAGDNINEDDEKYANTREGIIREFHSLNSRYKVIIANPLAVAESISLHKACHNAIYLERSFNATHFLQSKDRIHRYGLEKNIITNYYYLISKDSIDLTINERLLEKERRLLEIMENKPIPLFDNILNEDFGYEDIKAVVRDYHARKERK